MFNFSTIFTAIVASNLILILVAVSFLNHKIMENIGYRLLALFVAFSILRIVVLFEFPFAVNFFLPKFISQPLGQFQYFGFFVQGRGISFWYIFEIVWLIGIVISLLRYLILRIRVKHYIILHQKVITHQEPYATMVPQICEKRNKRNRFEVIELPGIETPMLYGILSPCIFIPENFQVEDTELYYYLCHEMTHHFHHDLLMKMMVKLITIVYWWNPFCIILNDKANMILEMRVDGSLTGTDSETTAVYTHCLLDMADRVTDNRITIPKTLSMSFLASKEKTGETKENVTQRTQMLLTNQQKHNLFFNVVLFMVVFAVYILSYMFTLETYYLPSDFPVKDGMGVFYDADIYAIENEDGTYDIYLLKSYMETVDSLLDYPEDLPIYKREDLPSTITDP